MALEHEFYLIPTTVQLQGFWMNLNNNPNIIDSVVIHDDIIMYISDTLKWIPSKNPAINGIPGCKGINYHGVTLFDVDSATNLKRVITSWSDLFLNSPNKLELTGEFVTIEAEDYAGHYENLVFDRDDVLKCFEKLISFSGKVAEGKCYIYHCGI